MHFSMLLLTLTYSLVNHNSLLGWDEVRRVAMHTNIVVVNNVLMFTSATSMGVIHLQNIALIVRYSACVVPLMSKPALYSGCKRSRSTTVCRYCPRLSEWHILALYKDRYCRISAQWGAQMMLPSSTKVPLRILCTVDIPDLYPWRYAVEGR